jgi:hypothetical protein
LAIQVLLVKGKVEDICWGLGVQDILMFSFTGYPEDILGFRCPEYILRFAHYPRVSGYSVRQVWNMYWSHLVK